MSLLADVKTLTFVTTGLTLPLAAFRRMGQNERFVRPGQSSAERRYADFASRPRDPKPTRGALMNFDHRGLDPQGVIDF
jgi:hypothetical protein